MKNKGSLVMETFIGQPLKQLCTVPIIVVYNSPSDHPGKYVARLWDIRNKPTAYAVIRDSLEEVRKCIPGNMARLGRVPIDDPVIVETWV